MSTVKRLCEISAIQEMSMCAPLSNSIIRGERACQRAESSLPFSHSLHLLIPLFSFHETDIKAVHRL